jgi:hypothetical protein
MRKTVIGCDPGAKGAICFLQVDDGVLANIHFMDNSKPVSVIYEWLSNASKSTHITRGCIEDVHSLFGMSAASNFNFGKNLGIVETLLKLQNYPLDTVQPKAWQKFIGLSIPKDIKGPIRSKAIKARVSEICEDLYPGCEIWGQRGGLMDGRSDSLMIAHYCLKHLID